MCEVKINLLHNSNAMKPKPGKGFLKIRKINDIAKRRPGLTFRVIIR